MFFAKRNSLLKVFVVLLTALVCYTAFSEYFDFLDKDLILSKLNATGLSLILILFPYFFIILSDTWGWKYSFGKVKNQISSAKLFLLRLATETLQTSLPAGAVYAEVVRPILLKKYFRLEYHNSISANIITKVNILIAQLLFFILGICIITISLKDEISLLSLPEYAIYLSLLIVIAFPILIAYLIYKKYLLLNLLKYLERINLRPVKGFINKIKQPVIEINKTISHFSKKHKKDLCLTVVFFFSTWFLMSLESLIILKVIGVDVNIFRIVVIESLISFVRMIFFFIPGAVGPQELVIIILFKITGISDPQINAIAFLLFKRLKEFFWVVVGYILLIMLGISPYNLIKSKKIEFAPAKEIL